MDKREEKILLATKIYKAADKYNRLVEKGKQLGLLISVYPGETPEKIDPVVHLMLEP